MSCFLLAVIAVLYSGLSSKSSFFPCCVIRVCGFQCYFSIIANVFQGPSIHICNVCPNPTYIFFCLLLTYLEVSEFAQGVLGPRYQESSYLHRLITSLDSMAYMFGVDGFDKIGMRIGDSAVVMRTVLAGIVFQTLFI